MGPKRKLERVPSNQNSDGSKQLTITSLFMKKHETGAKEKKRKTDYIVIDISSDEDDTREADTVNETECLGENITDDSSNDSNIETSKKQILINENTVSIDQIKCETTSRYWTEENEMQMQGCSKTATPNGRRSSRLQLKRLKSRTKCELSGGSEIETTSLVKGEVVSCRDTTTRTTDNHLSNTVSSICSLSKIETSAVNGMESDPLVNVKKETERESSCVVTNCDKTADESATGDRVKKNMSNSNESSDTRSISLSSIPDETEHDATENGKSSLNNSKKCEVTLNETNTVCNSSEKDVASNSTFTGVSPVVETSSTCSKRNIENENNVLHEQDQIHKSIFDRTSPDVDKSSTCSKRNIETGNSVLCAPFEKDEKYKPKFSRTISDVETCSIDSASVADSESTMENTETEYVPYYYENFLLILKTVMELAENKKLFNADDLSVVKDFYSMSEGAQKLYIRIFQRKHRWILQSRINYVKIASNLSPYFEELVNTQLLLNKDHLTELDEILHLLPSPELRTLAKSLRINVNQSQKSDIVEAILKHSQQKSISSFFTKSSNDSSAHVRKSAKALLSNCYKVEAERRGVFLRVLMLFSLTSTRLDDDSMYSTQHQLFRMLMTNIGEIVYPEYSITRKTAVFRTRQDVIWLEKSLSFELEMSLNMERHKYEAAREIYMEAKQLYHDIQSDKKLVRWDKNLPDFLKCFTASSILTRVLTQGVEVLQKLRDYSSAVDQLRYLMKQKVYLLDYRGRWCDRLALNLDQHLKQPGKALDVIKSALSDPNIRGPHRWSVYQRARRICLSPSNKKLKERLDEFQHDEIQVVTKITIEGRLFPREIPGRKTVFITQSSDTSLGSEEITLCGVEELVLDYYKTKLGYTDGIHGEGSVYLTLFGLFFWDIIFADGITDVFYGPYQTEPLDMSTESFYKSRKERIDSLLILIQNSDVETLNDLAANTWTKHYGAMCSVVNWARFESLEQAQSLITCMKGEFLAAIFERFCKDLRHFHSGLPDLIMWNTEQGTFKISEVKGPGDRLSTKQELWLDFFSRLGCDVEVCHVVGVGARKLRPSLT